MRRRLIPGQSQRRPPSGGRPIRTAEVVGALSIATDLGTGQPLEHALRTAVLAVRLGELAGASAKELADTYYVANDGVFKVVRDLGVIDPNESEIGSVLEPHAVTA